MIKIHNVDQGSEEWFSLRLGTMTASNAQAIGNNGKGLETYIKTMMAEKYSKAPKEVYTNPDLERGKELEEQAREIYSLTKENVETVGFVTNDKYKLAGASPDGLIGEKGMIEIKCMNDVKHFTQILSKEIEVESGYFWQMQMQMMITERDWVDYVLYNPNYEESLLVKRVEKDEEYFKKLEIGLLAGEEQIKQIELLLNK